MKPTKPDNFISTTELGVWLGLHVTVETLARVIEPAMITRTGVYWHRSDLPKICLALSEHFKQKAEKAS